MSICARGIPSTVRAHVQQTVISMSLFELNGKKIVFFFKSYSVVKTVFPSSVLILAVSKSSRLCPLFYIRTHTHPNPAAYGATFTTVVCIAMLP